MVERHFLLTEPCCNKTLIRSNLITARWDYFLAAWQSDEMSAELAEAKRDCGEEKLPLERRRPREEHGSLRGGHPSSGGLRDLLLLRPMGQSSPSPPHCSLATCTTTSRMNSATCDSLCGCFYLLIIFLLSLTDWVQSFLVWSHHCQTDPRLKTDPKTVGALTLWGSRLNLNTIWVCMMCTWFDVFQQWLSKPLWSLLAPKDVCWSHSQTETPAVFKSSQRSPIN